MLDGAVAVDAGDLNGIADLSVQLPVAVDILFEVAVRAMHAPLEMDILEVHGHVERELPLRGRHRRPSGWIGGSRLGRRQKRDGLLELVRRHRAHDLAIPIEQAPLPILLEHGPKDPTVSMKVAELNFVQFRIEIGEILEKRIARRTSAAIHRRETMCWAIS